ncbi:MAG: NAD-dependent epimerase/dehydratase family protein [Sphingobacteriaceae bacterium]|nr:NAD-dependent epimerase/dehydratase family protein [Sphingobacteriaceae bacterium]
MNADSKILITGGAGFIGSNIVAKLVSLGYKNISVLDNLETGFIQNIQEFIEENKIEFIRGDITDYQTCLNVTAGKEIILHQAALGSVPRSIEFPMNTLHVNVNGFNNMLDAARINKVKRFVYASSSSVYGDDLTLPKKEDIVGNPLSPYAISKKTNELYAKVYADLYGMEIIGLRYFNVFGPKQNPNGPYAAVIPIFIHNLLTGKPCNIYGDGTNQRDFTFIDNVVHANLLAASSTNSNAFNKVYNIAFGSTKSVNELYKFIADELKSNSSVNYLAPRKGEIKDSFASIDFATEYLNYKPEVNLIDGIRETIKWMKTTL